MDILCALISSDLCNAPGEETYLAFQMKKLKSQVI